MVSLNVDHVMCKHPDCHKTHRLRCKLLAFALELEMVVWDYPNCGSIRRLVHIILKDERLVDLLYYTNGVENALAASVCL